jgi:O-antigen/teichoic acid export membrane protein
MNIFQATGNTLRYGAGALVLLWTSNLLVFFIAQIIVAIIIVTLIRRSLWRHISNQLIFSKPKFSLGILKKVGSFSAGMGINALVAILLANIDRLTLSKMATASSIGEYSLAFTAVGLLQLGIQPFYRVFFPKYSNLFSRGDLLALKKEYFYSCQLLAAGIIPLGVVGWIYAPELLSGWLGYAPSQVIEIFRWLLIGVCCSGLTWLPAAFQQSQGLTKLHIQMMLGALVIGFPIMVWMIFLYGTVGATALWVIHGISDLTIGMWLMHKRFLIGELSSWYKSVLLFPILISCSIAFISWLLLPADSSRLFGIFWSTSILLLIVFSTLFFVHRMKIKLN